jgi:hypothetical protein
MTALEVLGVVGRDEAVFQGLEADARLLGLALGPVVAVEADLGGVGEVRPELDGEGAEVVSTARRRSG